MEKTTRKALNILRLPDHTTFGGKMYQVNYQRCTYKDKVCIQLKQFAAVIEVVPGSCDGKPAPVCRTIHLKELDDNDIYHNYYWRTPNELAGAHANDIRKDMKCVTSAILRAFKKGTITLG